MKRLLAVCLLLVQVAFGQPASEKKIALIPQPVSMVVGRGEFNLSTASVLIATDQGDHNAVNFFADYLQRFYGLKLKTGSTTEKNYIRFVTRKFIKAPDKDAYALTVTPAGITIEGDTYAGTFYGVQTLLQLLPPVTDAKRSSTTSPIPAVTISDYPRFGYRGMHLDVCRHFFGVDYIKKYIDYLALHKLNYFHWHLTDDQGWRIEIKKHPELIAKGANRHGTIVGRFPGTKNDNLEYGGFYTQDEVKDVVAYAAKRFITVVPEIEMPGHASAAIKAYPWLSCFPSEPTKIPSHPSERSKAESGKQVQETWGVFNDVFCGGNDSTFAFLQDVLDEVLPLFPSQYIHIGGDECPKANWKRCPKCQARIKALGLKDEHGLQSYFITRMERYVNGKGKTIIGWDEILEGGLAPNAVVMSWRGEEGGIEAARQKHQVIMTPQKPVYFDHSQTKNEDSVTIGGYNPIEAVYAWDPIPKQLKADEAKYILGAQANVWAEYIKNPAKVEYHVFPRMSALSEVLWSPKEKRDWKDFERRLPTQFKRYELWKANYSKAYYDLKTSIIPNPNGVGLLWVVESTRDCERCEVIGRVISIAQKNRTDVDTTPVYDVSDLTRIQKLVINKKYIKKGQPDTLSIYDKFKAVFHINSDSRTEAWQKLYPGKSPTVQQQFFLNIAIGKKANITVAPNERYPGQGGAFGLVNGIHSTKGLSHPDWLGWIGDDLEATIDLGKTQPIDSVRLHTINQNGSWIYLPEYVEVSCSTDGKSYQSLGKSSTFVSDTLTSGWVTVPVSKKQTRFIKLLAKNYGRIPDGQPGGGNKAWLMADEIQVY